MSSAAANLMISHLLNNAPFHVRANIGPVFFNFQSPDDVAMLESMMKMIGPRDMACIYEAAQFAQDMLDAS